MGKPVLHLNKYNKPWLKEYKTKPKLTSSSCSWRHEHPKLSESTQGTERETRNERK